MVNLFTVCIINYVTQDLSYGAPAASGSDTSSSREMMVSFEVRSSSLKLSINNDKTLPKMIFLMT